MRRAMRHTTRVQVTRSAELSGGELEDLRLKQWRVECPHVQLTSRGKGRRRTYSGPGYLQVTSKGQLAFHFYSRRRVEAGPPVWHDLPAGAVIPDEALFDLLAVDQGGRRWRSERLLPPSVDLAPSGTVVVDGTLNEIVCRATLPKYLKVVGHRVGLLAFQELELPWNAGTATRSTTAKGRKRSRTFRKNAWAFACNGLDILVTQHEHHVSLDAHSRSKRLKSRVELRLQEALEFVVGETVDFRVITVRRARTVETTIRIQRATARWDPPLAQQWLTVPGTNRITSKHHRRLFAQFLRHGLAVPSRSHAISGQLAAVREASGGRYLDAYALTLSVVVEALLFSEFSTLRVSVPKEVVLGRLLDWVRAWSGDDRLKARVIGAISQIRQIRAGDLLRALVRRRVLEKAQADAWVSLRNVSTHAYQLTTKPEELRTLVPEVQNLFYRLIFEAIRYRGAYTDYASPGWPVRYIGSLR
jgi:hypothetical protein